jgi:hypothetical protein
MTATRSSSNEVFVVILGDSLWAWLVMDMWIAPLAACDVQGSRWFSLCAFGG